jgi:hypothetical protein
VIDNVIASGLIRYISDLKLLSLEVGARWIGLVLTTADPIRRPAGLVLAAGLQAAGIETVLVRLVHVSCIQVVLFW